jgi:poly-beta-hydroxyalkanoate depolymerase
MKRVRRAIEEHVRTLPVCEPRSPFLSAVSVSEDTLEGLLDVES